jgi:hypothetical protein
MAIALDIITRALRSINVLSDGETPTASMSQDALDSLNDVLEGWATENLMVYVVQTESFPLVSGQGSYSIGPGGNFNSSRPEEITAAYTRSGEIDYPLDLWTADQFATIGIKDLTSGIPTILYYETAYPLGRIHLWSVPDNGMTLFMNSLKPFSRLASLTSPIQMPPGYERALRYALAVELMPEYGASNQLIIELSQSSKADLKRRNHRPPVLSLDPALPRGNRTFNIYQRF